MCEIPMDREGCRYQSAELEWGPDYYCKTARMRPKRCSFHSRTPRPSSIPDPTLLRDCRLESDPHLRTDSTFAHHRLDRMSGSHLHMGSMFVLRLPPRPGSHYPPRRERTGHHTERNCYQWVPRKMICYRYYYSIQTRQVAQNC